MRRLVVAVGVAMLVAAITIWYLVLRPPATQPPGAPDLAGAPGSSGPVPGRVGAGSGAASSSGSGTRPHRPRGPNDPVNGFGAPGRLATVPDLYELTAQDGGGMAFVDLGGGKSPLHTYRTPEAQPRHALDVVVLDRSRAPLANAVVVIEKQFDVMGAGIGARAGGTTDASGRATIQVPNEALRAVALHRDGWTAVAEVAADATSLELALAGRGAITGRATYNGHPETFSLSLANGSFRIMYETDPDGTYKIASLPPGTWDIKCGLAQEITGGASKQDAKKVVVEDGKTATVDFAQTAGIVIVAEAAIPAGVANPNTITAFLFPGTTPPPDPLTVRTRARAENVPALLFGGADAMRPIQFHDATPGAYLVCELGAENLKEPAQLWGCAQVTVLDGDTVREVKLTLRAL